MTTAVSIMRPATRCPGSAPQSTEYRTYRRLRPAHDAATILCHHDMQSKKDTIEARQSRAMKVLTREEWERHDYYWHWGNLKDAQKLRHIPNVGNYYIGRVPVKTHIVEVDQRHCAQRQIKLDIKSERSTWDLTVIQFEPNPGKDGTLIRVNNLSWYIVKNPL